jgi:hypothetical protein
MKKILFTTFTAILLSSCIKDAQHTELKNNGFKVEFLFEQDGVKVYRFLDDHYHYFTTKGETMSTQTAHRGKSGSTSHEENIK